MRFIPTYVHGILDYTMGALLIVAPWLFGFADDGPETWVPVAIGVAVIVYSLMTRYELGVVGVFSMAAHLAMDGLGGVLLAYSPWLFGFADQVWLPHVVFGLAELGAAFMTSTVPTRVPRHASPRTA